MLAQLEIEDPIEECDAEWLLDVPLEALEATGEELDEDEELLRSDADRKFARPQWSEAQAREVLPRLWNVYTLDE